VLGRSITIPLASGDRVLVPIAAWPARPKTIWRTNLLQLAAALVGVQGKVAPAGSMLRLERQSRGGPDRFISQRIQRFSIRSAGSYFDHLPGRPPGLTVSSPSERRRIELIELLAGCLPRGLNKGHSCNSPALQGLRMGHSTVGDLFASRRIPAGRGVFPGAGPDDGAMAGAKLGPAAVRPGSSRRCLRLRVRSDSENSVRWFRLIHSRIGPRVWVTHPAAQDPIEHDDDASGSSSIGGSRPRPVFFCGREGSGTASPRFRISLEVETM